MHNAGILMQTLSAMKPITRNRAAESHRASTWPTKNLRWLKIR